MLAGRIPAKQDMRVRASVMSEVATTQLQHEKRIYVAPRGANVALNQNTGRTSL
jgi:hypothetical protein